MPSQATFFEPVRPAPATQGIVLRDYQAEDADEVCRQWDAGNLQVLCVQATGLGKSHLCAELAVRRPAGSQAMICVDSTDLALDLARTVKLHTGKKPGVFMGEFKENWQDADILVCTKQCLCYQDQYRSFDLSRLSTLVVDECLSGDSLVAMADGTHVPIESLVDGRNHSVLSFDERTGCVEPRRAFAVRKPIRSYLLRIHLSDGTTINCTDEHRIYTRRGYRYAAKLSVGDDIGRLPNAINSRNAVGGRLHVHSKMQAGKAQASKVSDWPLPGAIVTSNGQIQRAEKLGRVTSADRTQRRVGWRPNEVRNQNMQEFRPNLLALLSRWKKNRHRTLVKSGQPAGSCLVDYGRWLASPLISWNEDINGRVFTSGATAYSGLVVRSMENPRASHAREARLVLSKFQETCGAPSINISQAFRYCRNAIQALHDKAGGVLALLSSVSAAATRRYAVLQRSMPKDGTEGVQAAILSKPQALEWQRIERIETVKWSDHVYDLTVQENHNFFANGVLVHNCESGLANEYLLMLDYFLTQVPGLRLCGLTATPLPAGNRKITDLFSHAATQPGPLYRDLQWAYLNGWLVKPMQGVLRCSLDFASLKIRKQENGEADFSDRDIAQLMLQQEEREWLELAGGIYQIAKGHTAIVVCPNKTIVADRLAGYIEGHARREGHRHVAFSIHRNLGSMSYELMRRFKRGEFPVAVSCQLFSKGFDYDKVNMIFMLRRTRSLRLYTQCAGRGTRPLVGIRQQLSETSDPKERMEIIAQSEKPSCTIVDCIGINDDAKNILGVIDILGRGVRDDIKERVRRMMLDRAREQAGFDAFADEPVGVDVGDEARRAVKEMREEWESQQRSRLSGQVDVMYRVGESHNGRPVKQAKMVRGDSTIKQVKMLIALGMIPNYALALSKRQAQGAIGKYMKKNAKPDWQLVRTWERANNVFGA